MELICPVDSERLSRFMDGELPPADALETRSHVAHCPSCEDRLARFRLADGLLARVRPAPSRSATLMASVSVAAALVASLATNVLLPPPVKVAPRMPLRLSAPPSETLTSFYEMVDPPPARP